MKPAVFCIHYTRYEDTPRLASDFLATVAYDPTKPKLITIRPLRIFYTDYNSLAAKQESDNVAVKIGFNADVTYLERQHVSVAKGVIDGTILAAQFDKNKLHSLKDSIYVLYKETVPGLTVPLPPWTLEWKTEEEEAAPGNATSEGEHVSWPKHSQLSASISVSEVGSVPALLKDAADWFDKNKSGATKEFTSLLQGFASSVDKLKSSAASTGGAAAGH